MVDSSRCHPSSPRSLRGFTLLELLIAISMTGLIMLLAYGGIGLSISSWQKTTAAINREEDLHLVYGFMRRQLAHAQLPVKLSPALIRNEFTGTTLRMSFVAPLPGRRTRSTGLQRFSLAFSEAEDGLRLEIMFLPELGSVDLLSAVPSTAEELKPRVLIEELEAGAFSYFGTQPPARHEMWHQAWTTPEALPMLVKIELSSNHQGVDWPAMIIPVYTGSAIP